MLLLVNSKDWGNTFVFQLWQLYSNNLYTKYRIKVWRSWDRTSWYISILKPTRCTIFRVYWISLYIFRTVFPSNIRSARLYIHHQVYVTQVRWLLASGHEMFHLVPASKQSAESGWHIRDGVCTVLNSWWWTERPSETYRVLFNTLEKLCI